MTGLDTNVLVRYLTQDDPAQAQKANAVIDRAEAGSLFISSIVLCEAVWVLAGAYGLRRSEIADTIEKVLRVTQFVFEDRELACEALAEFRQHKGDLADHLLGRKARKAGCTYTLTFDKALASSRLFRLL